MKKAIWGCRICKKTWSTKVEFSAEDATRSDLGFLKKIFNSVQEVGADRIDIPDTVGYSTPEYISNMVHELIDSGIKVPISMHCHNDFGHAVANAISGINAGASCAHVTINGVGSEQEMHHWKNL